MIDHYKTTVDLSTFHVSGILGSQKTCLHSMLTILDNGIGTPSGPLALMETPKLSELMYKLIYMLAANKDTSAATLRYLRTSYDFLFRQLQHLPFNARVGKCTILIVRKDKIFYQQLYLFFHYFYCMIFSISGYCYDTKNKSAISNARLHQMTIALLINRIT